MSSAKPRILLRLEYERSAEAYLRSLPLEHFMEATPQATQREITLESLALVKARRRDVHVYNELLIQYPKDGGIGKVVPDNMVVVYEGELRAVGSYDMPLQPCGPLLVLEYVSKSSERKDYEESFRKYEQDLQIPYYLLFYPDIQELTLYHHDGQRYVTVVPDDRGRRAIPELELEVGLQDGWVRFWYQGQLLPLPAELDRQLQEAMRRIQQADRRVEQADRRAEQADRRAEQADRHLQEATRLREEAKRRVQEDARLREAAEQARLGLEQELARLRAQMRPASPNGGQDSDPDKPPSGSES
jgi:Uma2 family endonuclease